MCARTGEIYGTSQTTKVLVRDMLLVIHISLTSCFYTLLANFTV